MVSVRIDLIKLESTFIGPHIENWRRGDSIPRLFPSTQLSMILICQCQIWYRRLS